MLLALLCVCFSRAEDAPFLCVLFQNAGSGYILETRHSWSLLFAVVAGLHVLGGLVYICFSDSKARFQNASGSECDKMAL